MATQGDEFPAEVGFAAIFAASPDGLLVVDGSGRIRLANPAVEHMFGYAAGELIGHRASGAPVHAPGDGWLVFPNARAAARQEWFYFARASQRFAA